MSKLVLKSGNIISLYELISKTDFKTSNWSIEEIDDFIFTQNNLALKQFRKVLRDANSKEPLQKLFKILFGMNSKAARTFLLGEIKDIFGNEEVSTYYSTTNYLRLFDDNHRMELYEAIPANVRDWLVLQLFQDSSEENYDEEVDKATWFLVKLGSPVFRKVIDLIKEKPPEEIVNLFKPSEYTYYWHLPQWEQKKFLNWFDDSVTEKCLRVFTEFITEDFRKVKYDLNGIHYFDLVRIMNILIGDHKDIWSIVFTEKILPEPEEERLVSIMCLLLEGCLTARTKDDLTQFFKNYTVKTICTLFVKIIDSTKWDYYSIWDVIHINQFRLFGPKVIPLLFCLLKNAPIYNQEDEYFIDLIKDFKDEYPDLVKDGILRYLKEDLSDYDFERFILELTPALEDTIKISLLLNERETIISKINAMTYGEPRYYVINHLLEFFLEKIKLSKTISLEFLFHILLLNMDVGRELYVENEFKFVWSLFGKMDRNDLLTLLTNEELQMIENLNSRYLRTYHNHRMIIEEMFYIMYTKLVRNPNKIIDLHNQIPEELRKELIQRFKRVARKYDEDLIEFSMLMEDGGEPDDWCVYHPEDCNKPKLYFESEENAARIIEILESNPKPFVPYQNPNKNVLSKEQQTDDLSVLNRVAQILGITSDYCDDALSYYRNIVKMENLDKINLPLIAYCMLHVLGKKKRLFGLSDIWAAFKDAGCPVSITDMMKIMKDYQDYFK